MGLTQEHRSLALTTALGPDALAIRSMSLREELGRLFQIDVDIRSEAKEPIDWDAVVGHPATIRLFVAQKQSRYFHGIVSRLVQGANVGGFSHYRATIVPHLWLLTRVAQCRIFQNLSVPQIIRKVLNGLDVDDRKLVGTYEPREYCVQYRETDFNFVSRLMEEEGIYYHFQHADGQLNMVLGDAMGTHSPFPGYAELQFHEIARGAATREVITDWTIEREVQSTVYSLADYNFENPSTNLSVRSQVPQPYPWGRLEMYDYPGEYLQHDRGERLVNLRLHELQSQYEVLHGETTARGLASGSIFTLKNHPIPSQNGPYLVTAVTMEVDSGGYSSDDSTGENFSCHFRTMAIKEERQFRPARLTPKPIIQGPQTAVVVGAIGEEIFTDKYGRVKVQFHWDREGRRDENSSCWIRVSQVWAGKNWGAIQIPRMGQEVIVEFLEGDPDRPIITGRVYNAEQMPPYALKDNKTQSGIKSRSSKGGTSANFNEIRFEDKKGSEEIHIHAEKDQNNLVENNESTWVGHNRSETVDHDETIHIKHDRTETVDNDETITINNNRTEKVVKNETIDIGVDRTETVGANESITVGSNRTRQVGQNEDVTVGLMRTHTVGVNEAITVGAAQEVTIGGIQAVSVGVNQTNTVGKDRTTSVGKDDTLNVAKKLSITAGDEILIKTGEASILMKKDGTITIKGKDITIEGSGKITGKASKDLVLKGKKILQN